MAMSMWAWAHAAQDRKITVHSIGNYRTEVSETTKSDNGEVAALAKIFENMKRPAPFVFIWKPDIGAPASLITSLNPGDTFSFDLRIRDITTRASFDFNFNECKLLKSRFVGSNVRVEATYTSFDALPGGTT
jgi:hypothetical protein